VPAEHRGKLLVVRDTKLEGARTTLHQLELLARDGHRIPVEVASRLIEEDGRPIGTEAICRDMSERLLLEEQLRQSQRLEAVGRLAGGVAHDFNNILTVIGGYTEALLDEGEHGTEELEQIAAATTRATHLTRQLLAFSRQQVLKPQALLLNDVVDGLMPMLTRVIGEDVELVASLEPALDPVLADAGQLEQVLINLAVNARDAMPDGGHLTIQTANVELDEEYVAHHGEASTGRHVLLSVADSGSGMDPDTLAHAFEPFYTTKPVGVGTGLGLATVYGIVKQSGGSVWVYSEPGKGTTFKIYLPTTDAPVREQSHALGPAPADGVETILLAEDEESLRTLTARMLSQRGYDVIVAETASDALRIAEQESDRIDLLLTDLVMPELSGRALAERIGRIAPRIPVLFMSGYSNDAVMRNGSLQLGAAFLEKPFTANKLAAKVRQTLDAAHLQPSV
jgi:two-component system, cell cycle sensor histidine kinase and response regulator CckA